MKKIKKPSHDWNYTEYYSSDYMMRSQKHLKLALIIIVVAFFAFIISLSCMYFFYS